MSFSSLQTLILDGFPFNFTSGECWCTQHSASTVFNCPHEKLSQGQQQQGCVSQMLFHEMVTVVFLNENFNDPQTNIHIEKRSPQ